jgi:hypothetical protein
MSSMSERRRLAAALLAAAVATVGLAGAAIAAPAVLTGGGEKTAATAVLAGSGAATRSCGPAAALTLAHNGAARLYTPDRPHGPAPNGLQFPRVYGCLVGGSRVVFLGGGGRQQVELATVAGRFAGYGLRQMGVDTGSSNVRVVDLGSGRVVDNSAAATPVTRPQSFTNVAALVLNARGHVAWIGSKGSINTSPTFEVHKIDGPAAALLDSGPRIDASSLRRHGNRISWTDAGRRRTAPLR